MFKKHLVCKSGLFRSDEGSRAVFDRTNVFFIVPIVVSLALLIVMQSQSVEASTRRLHIFVDINLFPAAVSGIPDRTYIASETYLEAPSDGMLGEEACSIGLSLEITLFSWWDIVAGLSFEFSGIRQVYITGEFHDGFFVGETFSGIVAHFDVERNIMYRLPLGFIFYPPFCPGIREEGGRVYAAGTEQDPGTSSRWCSIGGGVLLEWPFYTVSNLTIHDERFTPVRPVSSEEVNRAIQTWEGLKVGGFIELGLSSARGFERVPWLSLEGAFRMEFFEDDFAVRLIIQIGFSFLNL